MTSRRVLDRGGGDGPRVGDVAPGFTLRQSFDHDVSLDELLARSAVVLCFYVFDFGHV